MVRALSVKGYVLKRDKAISLIERADLVVGGLAVKKHEPAANLLEYHAQFVRRDREDIFHMNRIFVDRQVFAYLTDQIPDYLVFLKEQTGKFSSLRFGKAFAKRKDLLRNGEIGIETDVFGFIRGFSVPKEIGPTDIGHLVSNRFCLEEAFYVGIFGTGKA
jgi:hypothetical protein